ncbi:hypothetical protein DER29_4346 [Micromonospora sp. M71_S20]|uniref:DUF7426 family protein n=1 Tax=Micromonospora sp. M71_S20 TaxID=592872 RepID=UPI000EB02ACE|nr:hypothetical protein [Micromonospora sp. M71_S20]RLK13328.1 hypothetical protein DER29_4346 [Micromonospora sp. M71_S20]
MAKKFGDLDEYWSPGLTLTVKGKEYTVPLASAELGLWCRRIAQITGDVHGASTEADMQAAVERIDALPELPGGGDVSLPERVLGPVYQQMAADGVEDPYIQFSGQTAYLWIIGGEEAAERFWTSGGHPEALGPTNRKERRAAAAGQTSTGGANGTRTPASTSGTRSPKTSGGSGRARRSRGRRS